MEKSIQSAKTRLAADCGSDHELLIAKFRLKLKKVGKSTRPFRYDLNQIPYSNIIGRFISVGIWSRHCSGGMASSTASITKPIFSRPFRIWVRVW